MGRITDGAGRVERHVGSGTGVGIVELGDVISMEG